MFDCRIGSKLVSREMPPKCATASTPSTRPSTAALSARSHCRTSSPGPESPSGARSETRRTRAWGFNRSRSILPRPPAAPVSSNRSNRCGEVIARGHWRKTFSRILGAGVSFVKNHEEKTHHPRRGGPRRRLDRDRLQAHQLGPALYARGPAEDPRGGRL